MRMYGSCLMHMSNINRAGSLTCLLCLREKEKKTRAPCVCARVCAWTGAPAPRVAARHFATALARVQVGRRLRSKLPAAVCCHYVPWAAITYRVLPFGGSCLQAPPYRTPGKGRRSFFLSFRVLPGPVYPTGVLQPGLSFRTA